MASPTSRTTILPPPTVPASRARTVIQRGLAQMWQVGPGGEHYDIMAGTFSEIGCGIAVNGAEVTVTQDFR
jgi:hypothetical protein